MNKYLWTALVSAMIAIWVCFPLAIYLSATGNIFQLSFVITGSVLMIIALLAGCIGIGE